MSLISTTEVRIPGYSHPARKGTWVDLKQRCFNPKHPRFKDYGGRGITVCPEWIDSFSAFWADMGDTWFEGATLHRKNNDGHYTKENCCWLTRSEHSKLPRKKQERFMVTAMIREIEFDGSTESYVRLTELAKMLSVSESAIADWSRRYPTFPVLRLPGALRARPSEVAKWLREFNEGNK